MKNRTTIQLSEGLRKELRILASRRDISYQELIRDMIDVFRELDNEKTIISIPASLSDRIKQHIKNTDMGSVSEYVVFILRLILSEGSVKLEKKDEEKIKRRLRKLGYLS